MKRILALLLALFLVTACTTPAPAEPVEEMVYEVALMVGALGDLSFSDSAARGVARANEEFDDVNVTVIEHGAVVDRYEPAFLDTADQGYDMIIVSSTLRDFVVQYAADYPDTAFVVFDSALDFSSGFTNAYGIQYKANEAAYLGGFLAASLSETGVIAFLGGMDIPVISDFLVGYIRGAQVANPDIKVTYRYSATAGSATPWNDPAKGKELALVMFNTDNADILFNVAGGTGIGGIEASFETGNLSLGVDSDQAMIFESQGKTNFSEVIVSSVLKNVDDSLYRAISLFREGKLPLGTNEALGIAEGGVGLADNKFYQAAVSAELRAEIADLREKVISGALVIESGYGKTTEEIEAIRSAVRP